MITLIIIIKEYSSSLCNVLDSSNKYALYRKVMYNTCSTLFPLKLKILFFFKVKGKLHI